MSELCERRAADHVAVEGQGSFGTVKIFRPESFDCFRLLRTQGGLAACRVTGAIPFHRDPFQIRDHGSLFQLINECDRILVDNIDIRHREGGCGRDTAVEYYELFVIRCPGIQDSRSEIDRCQDIGLWHLRPGLLHDLHKRGLQLVVCLFLLYLVVFLNVELDRPVYLRLTIRDDQCCAAAESRVDVLSEIFRICQSGEGLALFQQ